MGPDKISGARARHPTWRSYSSATARWDGKEGARFVYPIHTYINIRFFTAWGEESAEHERKSKAVQYPIPIRSGKNPYNL
jgi:hypothetical protein